MSTCKSPYVIAHRGASRDAPENTLAAFQLAWEQGADGIEGDFRLTGDGHVVCMHDATTERVGDRSLVVAESSLAELRQVDVGTWHGTAWRGTRVPCIDEVLALVPRGKRIFLEVKCGPEAVEPIASELAASGLDAEQSAVISFHREVIAEAKGRVPAGKAFLLVGAGADRRVSELSPEAILTQLQDIGADGVDVQAHPRIDRRFVERLHARGKEVHVWVVDDGQAAQRLRDAGVDSVTTNCPGLVRAAIVEGKSDVDTGEEPG